MIPTERFEQVEVASPAQLRDWLEHHHEQHDSVWLVTWKKATGARYVSREQVLDELLCYGWIDGVARTLDDERTMQLISPRRVQHWAASYKSRVARLTERGRMRPAGLRSVEAGKASGLHFPPYSAPQISLRCCNDDWNPPRHRGATSG